MNALKESELRELFKLANKHEAAGALTQAEACYLRIVERDPSCDGAWHALGVLALRNGQGALAVQRVETAIAHNPRNAIYHRNLCEMQRRQRELRKAEAAGLQACRLAPSDADAHYNLGLVYADLGHHAEAARLYRQALQCNPSHGLAWNNLGSALSTLDDRAGAIAAYEKAIALNPQHVEAQLNLGLIFSAQGANDAARCCYQAALDAQPDCAEAHHHLSLLRAPLPNRAAQLHHEEGVKHYHQNRFDEALASFEQALALKPDFSEALNSKGYVLQDMGRLDEALACFSRSVELAPELPIPRLNLGMLQLKLGQWEAGWENYEVRWTGSAEASKGGLQRLHCPLPVWNGEGGTQDKRILITTEQGFGDTFQFARYLPLLSRRFAKVGFGCPAATQRLMEWSFSEEVVLFTRMPVDMQQWDLHCSVMSLPRAFGTMPDTIPSDVPYLRVPRPARLHWRERIESAAPGKLRVGIAWAGRKTHHLDARRSLEFAQLQPLFAESRIAWFSLQKWTKDDTRPAIPVNLHWIDWTDELADFADTAAMISGLDLVISVDSAMVHLAGALGKTVWMMNRFDGEWRWFHQRTDSPWYPALRIFNARQFGQWQDVVDDIATALTALADAEAPQAPSTLAKDDN